jgi:hypothetical protein
MYPTIMTVVRRPASRVDRRAMAGRRVVVRWLLPEDSVMAAPTPVENPAAVRDALADIIRDHGVAALDQPRLVARLLPDLLAESTQAIMLVNAAAATQVARLLNDRRALGMPITVAVNDVAAVLAKATLLQPTACAWIVGEFAIAIGAMPVADTAGTSHPSVARYTASASAQPTDVHPVASTEPMPGSPSNPPPPVEPQGPPSPAAPTLTPTQPAIGLTIPPTSQTPASPPSAEPSPARIQPTPLTPAPVRKRSNTDRIIDVIIAVVVVIAVIGVIYGINATNPPTSSPDNAKVGDCIAPAGATDVKVVKCDDASAQWTVLGRVSVSSRPDQATADSKCSQWPTFIQWTYGSDYLLCLGPKA